MYKCCSFYYQLMVNDTNLYPGINVEENVADYSLLAAAPGNLFLTKVICPR
jgi:hypothetical protein